MTGPVYTHAMWHVRAGHEELFIQKWEALAEVFSHLEEKPLWGTLIRSTQDPSLFYSFGPWHSETAIAAMREHTRARAAFEELMGLCEQATPSTFRMVLHVEP